MKNTISILLSLAVLAPACGDNLHPAPDAAVDAAVDAPPDAPDNPRGPATWWDAYLDWGTAYCEYLVRCYPASFEANYDGYLIVCQSDVAQKNCDAIAQQHLPVDCRNAYPASLDTALAQCQIDMLSLDCASTTAPASCLQAMRIDP